MRVVSLQDIVKSTMERPPMLGAARLVAVDGRSGSGKSTFAKRLARIAVQGGVDVALVHTDDLLDGWGHPTKFEPQLRQWIIDPIMTGREASYRAYDWHAKCFSSDWRYIGSPDLLILDGVATASVRWHPLLSYAIVMHAAPELCRERGFARDGEALRQELEAWQADEDRYFQHDSHIANVIVDGDPSLEHDPESQCVVFDTPEPESTDQRASGAKAIG